MYSPYQAPQNQYPHNPYAQQAPYPGQGYVPANAYVPLGWRTWLASFGVGSVVLASFAVDISTYALGEATKVPEPTLGAALVLLFTGLGLVGAYIFGAVTFSIWVHRAAKNLIGLGRQGMEFTPGWCVGWFFVPFANLVRPFKAVQEIWRASDPEAAGGYWMHLPTGPIMALWWGAWIAGNILANVSTRIDDPAPSAMVGALGSVATAIAALGCILVMHRIAAKQQASAGR